MLRYVDSKGRLQKVSPVKFYTRPLYERISDFDTLIRCGRLFQQFLCEMFVKVGSKMLSFLRQNQSKLRANDHTYLCELLTDAAMNKNELQEWTRIEKNNSASDFANYLCFHLHTLVAIGTCAKKCTTS